MLKFFLQNPPQSFKMLLKHAEALQALLKCAPLSQNQVFNFRFFFSSWGSTGLSYQHMISNLRISVSFCSILTLKVLLTWVF